MDPSNAGAAASPSKVLATTNLSSAVTPVEAGPEAGVEGPVESGSPKPLADSVVVGGGSQPAPAAELAAGSVAVAVAAGADTGLVGDGVTRTAHVARARENFGSSTPEFKSKCQALLSQLSTCADIRQEYLLATARRKEAEKGLEVASTWVQVRKIEAATAKLKLARLQAEKAKVPAHKEALVDVARCELKVKQLEEEVVVLKEKDVSKKVVKARELELSRLALLNQWNATIATVKEFPRVMADTAREKFYFSYCNQEGHAPWYCEVLSKRPSWQEYPAVKWFCTKKGTQLYCPVGNVSVDYSDQHVYSRVTADMPGHEHVTFKGKLALLGLSCHPRSWHIVGGQWVEDRGGAPPAELDDGKTVWFLKDTLRNYSMGIELCKSPSQCFAKAEADKTYVVQRQVLPYLVGPEKKKQHMRVYFAAMSAIGTTDIRFVMYHDGWLALTPKPYDPNGTDKDTQVSRDRDCRLSEWDLFPSLEAKLHRLVTDLASKVRVKLRPEAHKHAFLLLGLDVMIDDVMELWLLECNAGPVIRRADYPMLESLMVMAVPADMAPLPAEVPIAADTHSGWLEVVLPPPSDEERAEKAAEQAKADDVAAKALQESVAAQQLLKTGKDHQDQKQNGGAGLVASPPPKSSTTSVPAAVGVVAGVQSPAAAAGGEGSEGATVNSAGSAAAGSGAADEEAVAAVSAAEVLAREMPMQVVATEAQRVAAATVAAAMANDANNIYQQDESDGDDDDAPDCTSRVAAVALPRAANDEDRDSADDAGPDLPVEAAVAAAEGAAGERTL